MVSNPSGRLHSLRQRSDFLEISKTGRQLRPCGWIVIAYRTSDQGHWRFGWTIPKYVGIAVVRNRLRRWCREYFRAKDLSKSQNYDINIIFRRREKDFFKNVKRDDLFNCLEKAVERLSK